MVITKVFSDNMNASLNISYKKRLLANLASIASTNVIIVIDIAMNNIVTKNGRVR